MLFGLMLSALLANASPALPQVSYVTVVVMENRNYGTIVGNDDAPYINDTLIPQGALLSNSRAVAHPSEPNYLALFAGSTLGVDSDACPLTFSSANLASELAAAGKRFVGWSESLPHDGYEGCFEDSVYARKHAPWVNFTNVPPSSNLVYRGLPVRKMPEVSFVDPNLCNDMHDCSTHRGDRWLSENLPPIIAWNAKHDGLLIVTWDEAEPDNGGNRIATILVGPMVKPGSKRGQYVDHYGVLRTIESFFGLPCIAKDCQATTISGIWR
ncbi:MAG TPA: alkaline phosphatase family protein [Candidatus Baltobacteraceae bacterium]|nr:alkaline phosphatase family protein [Candidatus Baltobacteraceae bacterium]